MASPSQASPDSPAGSRRPSLAALTLLGLLAGVAVGLLFGEDCARLGWVGEAFVGLLQMTVLPFIVVTMVANMAKLSRGQSARLGLVGGCTLLGLWALGLLTVAALATSFPPWTSGSFFSVAKVQPAPDIDFLDIFIPANFFASLSENRVPGVILLSALVGLALAGLRRRRLLVAQLDVLGQALVRVSAAVTKASPVGVFAIAASTAGTMTLSELSRVQAYLSAYAVGALLLAGLVLPLLVTTLTPLRYRDVLGITKTALLTVLATGKLIIVLPLLVQETQRLLRENGTVRSEGENSVELLYPLAYAFPHVGKLLALLFIPFTAWFLGQPLGPEEYPLFLSAGLVSYFGGPLLATPYLLDLMHLPHDMFELFVMTGLVANRLGDALGVLHLVTFTLITTFFLTGRAVVDVRKLLRFLALAALIVAAAIVGLRQSLTFTLRYAETEEEVIARMQRLDEPVEVRLVPPEPNPEPLGEGESLLERIRRRGVLRVGYNEDKLPFAFFNVSGQLVGFDISMAEELAHDLGVSVEFVRFQRATLADQLADDHFDVVMSGLVGTLDRATVMGHTSAYLEVTLALVVFDHRVREFSSLQRIRDHGELEIGFVDLSRGFVERLEVMLPNAQLLELATNRGFFEEGWKDLDALLISAESGSAYSLLYPEFEAVVPGGIRASLPLFYAVGARDREMREFLEHWVQLRKGDGTFDEHYARWVLGRAQENGRPRWSILRDVLGWME